MKILSFLIFLFLSSNLFSQAEFVSLGGNWNSSLSWSISSGFDADGIPDGDDNVTIINNTINLSVNSACNSLAVSTNGVLNFGTNSRTLIVNSNCTFSENGQTSGAENSRILNVFGDLNISNGAAATISGIRLNVHQNTIVEGTLLFNSNTGVKSFFNTVTINPTGSWVSTAVTTNTNMIFQNGISNNGVSFSAGAARFNTNNQELNGNTNFNFSGIIAVDNVALTNNGNINHTSAVANALTGTGAFIQANNSTLNTSAASINISSFDASSNSNLVNYNRNNTQSIYTTTYYNLSVSVANTKTLTGNIVVNNDLEVNIATLATAAFTIQVNGNTTVFGNGNLSTTNALGLFDLQDVTLNTGRIIGSQTGAVNISNLTANNAGNNIGRGIVTINGNSTINGAITFSNNTGVKNFKNLITITPTGSWVSTAVTTNTNMIFQNGISNNGVSFSAGAVRFNTNNQELYGNTNFNFSGIITVVGIDLTNNSIVIHSSTSNNGITGTGSWIQGVSSELRTSVASINISSVNAVANLNLVNYNRNNNQTIFPTTYYNLNATVSGNKTLGGNTSVLNNLNIDIAAFLTNNRVLNVSGTTTINNNGNLNTSNASGVANLQDLIINSSSISGTANGTVNATSFTSNGLSNVIGTCRINISGATNFNGQTTFLSPTGNKTFSGIVNILASGELINNGGIILSGPNTWTNEGIVRSISGTMSIGNSTNNSLINLSGSTLDIQGGIINIAGALKNENSTFLQSGGTINLTTIGNNDQSIANFHSTGSSIIDISGGIIILRRNNSNAIPYLSLEIISGIGAKNISGGTFQIGDASTPVSQTFLVNSQVSFFNFTINSTNNPIVRLVTNNLIISGVLTMNGGNIDGATNSLNVEVTNPNANAIIRTNGLVNHTLSRSINSLNENYLFPVGLNSNYLPIELHFNDLSPGVLSVKAINGDEPDLDNSILNKDINLNIYWELTASLGLNSIDYNGTLSYPSSLHDNVSLSPNYLVGKNNSAWTYPLLNGQVKATNASFLEANGFGYIVLGTTLLTEIINTQCGITLTDNNTDIYCGNVLLTTIYEFKLDDGTNILTIQKPSRTFKFNQVSGMLLGTTYDVSIRTFTNGVWSEFGPSCQITSASGLASIDAAYCGLTLTDNNTDIYCTFVPSTTLYEFSLVHGMTTLTIQKPSRTFKISQVAGVLPGITYSVSVRTFTNGVWTAFGSACNITTASASTKIIVAQCGSVLTNLATDLYADAVIGATQYRFRVANSGGTLTIDKASRTFKLTQLANAKYDEVNVIDVDAFVNGSWIGYGATCEVTTPSIPSTNLMASQCGITLGTTTTYLYADQIFGATQYKFKITNEILEFSDSITRAGRFFRMSEIPGLEINTTYDVEVAFYINGDWEDYGSVCEITTPAILALPTLEDEIITQYVDFQDIEKDNEEALLEIGKHTTNDNFNVSAFPNPFDNEFTVKLNGTFSENSNLIISDATGKIIENIKLNNSIENKYSFGSNYSKGIYFVTIIDVENSKMIKIIKQ
jgi:hypothetical protein